ncbi:hypothetical protein BDP27DRAFT_986909 [Rhodocollybia butyracea]|uniref:Uncharacterized protein n=1 Tax=Rhodocollybia butyracea TaxID=206335 RepID=A0A9P5PNZ7_9AGAR|nr:hypothetical protein BDP27DRAFT_986909 [Rhodocollybia butyracea]
MVPLIHDPYLTRPAEWKVDYSILTAKQSKDIIRESMIQAYHLDFSNFDELCCTRNHGSSTQYHRQRTQYVASYIPVS